MIIKKQLIPAVAAAFLLAGCGASAATASGASGGTGSTGSSAVPAASHGGTTLDSSDGVPAGALPFPVAVGDKWVYRASSSSLAASTVTDKITAVKNTTQGTQVTEYYSNSNSTKFDGNLTWLFHPNGTITYPITQDLGIQIIRSSGAFILPSAAEVASGKAYHSTLSLTFAMDGKDYTEVAHITMRGAGTQTVTVPAGTYQNAIVLDSTFDMSLEGVSFDMQMKFWIAAGIGEVKGSVGGFGTDTLELESFTKG
jgi:hypothetical protein